MCLTVKKGTQPFTVEGEDMFVYKLVTRRSESVFSECRGFKYEPGELYECEIGKAFFMPCYDGRDLSYILDLIDCSTIADAVDQDLIDQYASGFHFFTSIERVGEVNQHSPNSIERFRIPIGATVILNGDGLGVTNKIIFDPE